MPGAWCRLTRTLIKGSRRSHFGSRLGRFGLSVWLLLHSGVVAAATPAPEPLFPAPGARPTRGATLSPAARLAAARAPMLTQTFVSLAQRLSPAVVNIVIDRGGEQSERGGDEGGRKQGREQGSGVIINARGYILTNNHVVEHARDIHVHLQDEREFSAQLIGRDERTDMALLRIDVGDKPLPWAPLGDSDHVQIGEWVMAIGSPFGLSQTVTVGIVSAKGRREVQPGSQPGFFDFLQTDAPINPGNSGGPLINVAGEVIGINSAMNVVGSGIGFAIPSNLARSVAEQLHRHGYVLRSWLGVYPQAVSEPLRKSFGLPDRHGALVAEVYADSPAAAAGLRTGDVITELGGHRVMRSDDLMWLLSNLPAPRPGEPMPVALSYYREGTLKKTSVRLPPPPVPPKASEPAARKPSSLGMAVTELGQATAERLGYDGDRGLLVLAVEPGSPALEGGADRGDIVLQVNAQPVRSLADYLAAVGQVKSGEVVRMLLRRFEVRPGRSESGDAPGSRENRRSWHNVWIAFVRR